MITLKKKSVHFRPSVAVRHEQEPVVQNGLALTPSDMQEMMMKGEAISAQHMAMIKDETVAQRNDFTVPLEHTRGFDMVDGWNIKHDVSERVRTLRNKVQSGEIPQMAADTSAE